MSTSTPNREILPQDWDIGKEGFPSHSLREAAEWFRSQGEGDEWKDGGLQLLKEFVPGKIYKEPKIHAGVRLR